VDSANDTSIRDALVDLLDSKCATKFVFNLRELELLFKVSTVIIVAKGRVNPGTFYLHFLEWHKIKASRTRGIYALGSRG
jgi:hypothetical protein